MKRYLAIDLGASGGRGIVGEYENGRLTLREVHRFESTPALLADGWHWDIIDILKNIKLAMTEAARIYGKDGIDSMGIDSWGVDYGLLDKNGALIHTPFHYRDLRTDKYQPEIDALISRRDVYGKNGLQFMNFNTLYQLYAHFHDSPYIKDCADCFLMIPQLLAYFLTGEKSCEYTLASTTGLVNAKTREWDTELMDALGIPSRIFPKISEAGTALGRVKADVVEETGLDVEIVHVASHDTASAVCALPEFDGESIYISSGTWSLMGVLLDEPMVTGESFECNFTNEGNPERKIRFLKNIMGMWLIQQARRVWNKDGVKRGYGEIAEKAQSSRYEGFIDPDFKAFSVICDMPAEVKKYCADTLQSVPESEGDVARCIYESLALKYRENVELIERLTGKHYDAIQIVGGGTNNKLMNGFTANATGKKVIAGPVEATATGNVLMQMIHGGDIKSIKEGSAVVSASEILSVYEPEDKALWNEKYEKYLKVTKK